MTKLKLPSKEIVTPSTGFIEKIAIELAGVWYDAARSSGLADDKYKNARRFAKHEFERFIPHAIKHCMEMLNNPSFDANAKMIIYDELMKRANDPEARAIFPSDTKADEHLNFKLPEKFIENNFPHLLEKPKVH